MPHNHVTLRKIRRAPRRILDYLNSHLAPLRHGFHVGEQTIIEYGVKIRMERGGSLTMGRRCHLSDGCILYPFGGDIKIGNGCTVGSFSVLFGHGGLTIGNDVRIGPHVVIVPANHNFKDKTRFIRDQGATLEGITIKDDVWLGAGVRITDGVCIERGCVIAAGAVVTKDTTAYGVYAGVPARLIDTRK